MAITIEEKRTIASLVSSWGFLKKALVDKDKEGIDLWAKVVRGCEDELDVHIWPRHILERVIKDTKEGS